LIYPRPVCDQIGSNQGAAAAMPILAAASTGFRKLPPIFIFLNVVSAWRHCRILDMHPAPLPWPPTLRWQNVISLTDTDRYAN
jgi:hypothetical protein